MIASFPRLFSPLPGLVILGGSLLHAAPMTWQPAQGVTDPSVVNSRGVLIEAVNASPAAGVVTVNGVNFSPSNALLANNAVNGALNGVQTLDPGLDELLTTMDYGDGQAASFPIGAGRLVSGQGYIVQVFFTDLRDCCSARVMTFGDGAGNTVDVDASGGEGHFGQVATGTFTADETTQSLTLAVNGFGNAHINAYQVRTAFQLPVIESFIATPPQIASGETCVLAWKVNNADSVEIDMGIGTVGASAGEATVSPAVTTTYTLSASNEGGSVSALVTVGVDVPVKEPVISEFLAANDTNLDAADGNFPDWIEIYNPNVFAVDLSGHFLTDDPVEPEKWRFPEGTALGGGGYLVVFASGTSRGPPQLHVGFKLASSGGYLALIAPDSSSVLSEFTAYPPQRTDISYGVSPGGGEGYFQVPTPGGQNATALAGFVADTAFDVDRGFFEEHFTVVITTPTPGVTVVHTLDGSEPSMENGFVTPPATADSPGVARVSVEHSTVLRAAAFKDGLMPTNTDTQTYLFAAGIIRQPEMDPEVVDSPAYSAEMIPALKSIRSLSIVTDPDNLFDSSTGILANTRGRGIDWERPVSVEFIDPDNPAASFQVDAGLRVHGNGSRGNPKNSLRLLFRGAYGAKKLDYPLFGTDWVAQRFNTVVLRAQNANSWTTSRAEDRRVTTFLQDTFAKDSQGAMGHPTSGSTFVHLFLNGTYWGLYNPTERPDGGFGEEHFGGDDADYDALNRRFSVEAISGTKVFWNDMITHSATLLDSPEEYARLGEFIDIDNLIDYMLLHQYMQTRDGPDDFGHNNMRLVRRNNPPGPFRLYAWDMEYSMIDATGTRDYSYPFPIYSSSRSGNRDITDSIASVYIRLKDSNPEFPLRYADRAYMHLFNGGALTAQNAAARWSNRAGEITSAVVCESARWGDQRRVTPYTRDIEWMAERERLLTSFFPARPAHVISQLRSHGLYPGIDPPTFSRHGGVVPVGFDLGISSERGTIHYTLDGSDPREAWSGNVAADAGSLAGDSIIETLVELGSGGWRYLDTGAAQSSSSIVEGEPGFGSSDWKHPDFDDSAWKPGTTPLGYGNVGSPAVTSPPVGFGGNTSSRHPTTYFRRAFQVINAADFTDLAIRVRRDDGAILYLNGHEIARTNMAAGTIAYESLAATGAGADEVTIYDFDHDLLPAQLIEGTNVLAVELHQSSPASSDLVIDVELKGTRSHNANSGVILAGSGRVLARVIEDGEWSALAAANFIVGAPASAENLVLSELHYHPLPGREGEEFIELMNVSAVPIDLIGVSFTEGVDFTFRESIVLAPGERILVVNDRAFFPPALSPHIAGEFENATSLSNGGERIALADFSGAIIFDFIYRDDFPWPISPDGDGPSLTRIAPGSRSTDPSVSSSWRPSVAVGGSPGAGDALTFTGEAEVDSDHDGLNALLEHAMGTSDAAPDRMGDLLSVSLGEGNLLEISLQRNLAAEDMQFTIQASADLEAWDALNAELQLTRSDYLGGGVALEIYRVASPGTRRFVRVVFARRQ
jgi:hypothetical protein